MWPFKWFKSIFLEIKAWIILYKVTSNKVFEHELSKLSFTTRVDWIGRLYSVIDIPEEYNLNETTRRGYVLSSLQELDKLLFKYNISDLVIPIMKSIPNSKSVLIVLTPELEKVNFWSLLIRSSITGYLIYLIIKYQVFLLDQIQTFINFFTNLFI